MAYIPFSEVKNVTTIERVVSWLGLSGTRMQCPVNQGDKRELAIFPKTQSFCCFGCKKAGKQPAEYSGDLIQLAAHIKQTPVKKEAAEIMKHFHGYEPAKRGFTDEAMQKIAKEITYEHEAVQALGISPERALQLGIGYRNAGTTKEAILFPMRDTTGQLLGYVIHSKGTLKLPRSLKDLK